MIGRKELIRRENSIYNAIFRKYLVMLMDIMPSNHMYYINKFESVMQYMHLYVLNNREEYLETELKKLIEKCEINANILGGRSRQDKLNNEVEKVCCRGFFGLFKK